MIFIFILALIIAAPSGEIEKSGIKKTGAEPTEGTQKTKKEKQPTIVTSERMDVDNNENIAIFTQNVHVKDIDGDMWADKMVVYFDHAKHELKKLISTGEKVIIITTGKESVSRKAVYTGHDGKIVLTGDPRITQGRNTYGADKITIFKNSEKTIFEPRARLIIHSKEGSESADEMF